MADEQATAPPRYTEAGREPVGPAGGDPRDVRLVLVGTACLLLTLPMPWYRTDVPGHEVHARGWQGAGFGFTVVAVLAALVSTALVLGRGAGAPWARRAPLTSWWLDGVVGAIPLVAVAGRLLWSDDFRSYGLVLGLVAAAVLAFAGAAASLTRRRAGHRSAVVSRP